MGLEMRRSGGLPGQATHAVLKGNLSRTQPAAGIVRDEMSIDGDGQMRIEFVEACWLLSVKLSPSTVVLSRSPKLDVNF